MQRLAAGQAHPMDTKMDLARRIVSPYHGAAAGERAAVEFTALFRERKTPHDMPEIEVGADLSGGAVWIVQLIGRAGFAASNREARQLVEQGAVSIDGTRVGDPGAQVRPADGSVLKVGKPRFAGLRTE